MGLKDLLRRWTKAEDRRAIERAEHESRMTPAEREIDDEDFEGRKDDISARSGWTGAAASTTASDDLEST